MAIKILHERDICIGCGACAAVCPSHWEMAGDGKSDLKDSKKEEGNKQSKEVDEKEMECNMEAAKSCPVNCIHMFNGDKKLI